jgi:hypothetical protein
MSTPQQLLAGNFAEESIEKLFQEMNNIVGRKCHFCYP